MNPVDYAEFEPDQRVLIQAAACGVDHLAVQIAKAQGAYVIGTARADQHDFVSELGIDEAIDYTRQNVGETVREIDSGIDSSE